MKTHLVATKADDHGSAQRIRPWKLVAEELTHEQDPNKLIALVSELNQALEGQGIGNSGIQRNQNRAGRDDGNNSGSSLRE
jgi:hypothetical protein